ncbi:O-antigen ligase family protein [Pseudomonas wayambapalatensis]|nr:O-antigen ligase family protein [Pseudomonas wayambapalatensis]
MFVLISGKVWIESGSGRNTQVYIFLLLPALLVFMARCIAGRIRLHLVGPYLPWLLYLGWVALSTLWSVNTSDDPATLAKRGLFIGLFLLAVDLFVRTDRQLFINVLKLSVGVVALGALMSLLYQYLYLNNSLAYREFRIFRLGLREYADYGWPVVAGIFHGALAVLALNFALERRARLYQVLFWLAVFAILSAYVICTYTRGAWGALAVAALMSVLLNRSRRGMYLLGCAALILLIALVALRHELWFELTERKLSGRSPIWEYFFSVMPDHWLFGHGLGTPFTFIWAHEEAVSPHAHSLYLQQVYDSGLVSLLLLLTGICGLFRHYRRYLADPLYRSALPVLVFALIAMLTDVERLFTRPGDYWVVFWLPVAILLSVRSCGRRLEQLDEALPTGHPVPLALTLLMFATLLLQNRDLAFASNDDITRLRAVQDVYRHFDFAAGVRNGICHSVNQETFERNCLDVRDKTMVIWGDSLAAALYPGLVALRDSRAANYGIVQATDGDAPPLLPRKGRTIDGRSLAPVNRYKLQLIQRLQPDVVILHWYIFGANAIARRDEAVASLARTIAAIHEVSAKSRVIVLGPAPAWDKPLVKVVLDYWGENFRMIPRYSDSQVDRRIAPWDQFLEQEVPRMGASYLSLYQRLCKGEACMVRVGTDTSTLTMVDATHISREGAIYVISQLADQLFGQGG